MTSDPMQRPGNYGPFDLVDRLEAPMKGCTVQQVFKERKEAAARIRELEVERDRLREALKRTTSLLEKDARNMATAFGVADWGKTAPHTAEIVYRARAALQTNIGGKVGE